MTIECAVITAYRCNARCKMCDIWKHLTNIYVKFKTDLFEKLPIVLATTFCLLDHNKLKIIRNWILYEIY